MRKRIAYSSLLICILLVTIACGSNNNTIANLQNSSSNPSESAANEEESSGESTSSGNPVDYTSTGGDTWLVMMYQDADDEILEQDIFMDLNEAEIVGSTDNVTIVSQLDRYNEAYEGDGDWTTTKRFLVTQDDDLETIASEELQDLGEVDMGDNQSLVEFATWAIENYPADKYALILSDHGAGWLGGWNDDSPNEGSSFSLKSIDEALSEIVDQSGIGMFEFVGFDACLMGQLEVFSAIAPYARFAVGSEETEPALGWAYAEFLSTITTDPTLGGDALAQAIVESYVAQDYRITNEDARQVFVEENFGSSDSFSADEVAAEMSVDITLTAVDLSGVRGLNEAVNQLALAMQDGNQKQIARARAYTQSFETVFDEDEQAPYIDLGHFASLLIEESDDENVQQAARNVLDAMQTAIIAEKHGDDRPGATGISIYFPNSDIFEITGTDYQISYTDYANRFAAASLWDDFLTYHYTGAEFAGSDADLDMLGEVQASMADLDEAAASSQLSSDATIESPASGEITLTDIELSETEIGLDGVVTVSTEITGENVGYIYYYVAWYDPDSESYLTADMGFITSEELKEVSGVTYPDWGSDATIDLAFDWDPTLYYLSNGNEDEDQFAFFKPEVFGATEATDVYSVYGVYTFTDSGEQYDAVIKFDGNGQMKAIYGFTDQDSLSQITPSVGDTFTISEEWLEFENNDEGELVEYEGGTLEFNGTNFTMEAYYGYEGDYILGVIVEDLDGNWYESYANLSVKE
jgi:clostripain